MKAKKQTKMEKIHRLGYLISHLNEKQIDALLTLLDRNAEYEFGLSSEKDLRVAEGVQQYGRNAPKPVPAKRALKAVRDELKKLKK
jgi:hypothetical protein